jgi:hypothetical protein
MVAAMKKWVGWVLLVLSLYVTYEGWQNSQRAQAVADLSKAAACNGREGCKVEVEHPSELRTSFLGHEYVWKTSTGPVTVSCQRALVFQGAWSCTA